MGTQTAEKPASIVRRACGKAVRGWRRFKFLKMTPQERFEKIYRENHWGNPESVSGWGSTLAMTAAVRRELPGLMARHQIKAVFDAPCGDYNWFRHIERDGVHYSGGDVVADLIAKNREVYGDAGTEFVVHDLLRDPLPAADLWICRDCLIHFSLEHIFTALAAFVRSDLGYTLQTTMPSHHENADITTGGFRLINLQLPPFSLPEPIEMIDEHKDQNRDKKLALWSREQVAEALKRAGKL